MQIGRKIKERRKEKGLSLRELADNVNLTASFLSQVERDMASPSIDSLRKISQALDVPVFYFLLESNGPDPVVKRGERRKVTLADSNITYELLTADINRKMEVIHAELPPDNHPIPLIHHTNTEECIYVIDGKLEVGLGDSSYVLEEGDCIYFEGALLTHIIPKGDKTVNYLSIITPPIF